MEKYTNQFIIDCFEKKGYEVVGEVKNSTTPILCEKNGYRYKISYRNLSCGKNPSLWGFNNIENLKYNILSFITKTKSPVVFLGYEVIQKEKKKRILLKFKCQCGENFNRVLTDAVYKKYILCNNCTKKLRGLKRRTSEKSAQTIQQAGYKILNKVENLTSSELVEVEDKDGFRGYISASKINSKKNMSKFDIRINKKYYVYNVNQYIKIKGLDLECIDLIDKRHTRQSLLFKCACGNIFVTSIASFQNGKVSCEECAKTISSYEKTFKYFLEENQIEYIYQYTLNQCRDILPLPFDFYLPKYNILVEIDGQGHFKPCNFNGMGEEKAIKSFEETHRHDKIKDSFCKENKIRLLRLPYYVFDKENSYKNIFQKFVEE